LVQFHQSNYNVIKNIYKKNNGNNLKIQGVTKTPKEATEMLKEAFSDEQNTRVEKVRINQRECNTKYEFVFSF
jgi:hypothetical protein